MKILVRKTGSRNWEPVESTEYETEGELQDLLARSPSLIPVDEIREGAVPSIHDIPLFKGVSADLRKWPTVRITESLLNQSDGFERFKEALEQLGKKMHAEGSVG